MTPCGVGLPSAVVSGRLVRLAVNTMLSWLSEAPSSDGGLPPTSSRKCDSTLVSSRNSPSPRAADVAIVVGDDEAVAMLQRELAVRLARRRVVERRQRDGRIEFAFVEHLPCCTSSPARWRLSASRHRSDRATAGRRLRAPRIDRPRSRRTMRAAEKRSSKTVRTSVAVERPPAARPRRPPRRSSARRSRSRPRRRSRASRRCPRRSPACRRPSPR